MQRECEIRGRTMFRTLYDFYVWVRDWEETCKKLRESSDRLDHIVIVPIGEKEE